MKESINIFWFRRDLRISDNSALYHVLKQRKNVLPIFIFDTKILSLLEDKDDARVSFIFQTLSDLKRALNKLGSDLEVRVGKPIDVFQKLTLEHDVQSVYCNEDYEPAAIQRDQTVKNFLKEKGKEFFSFKDQVIFEKSEVLTDQRKPYTVFTPYKRKWLETLSPFYLKPYPTEVYFSSLLAVKVPSLMPTLEQIGFIKTNIVFPALSLSSEMLKKYSTDRDFPALKKATSRLGLHLRFGTVSIRELAAEAKRQSDVWLSELIWREFFMQILWHYPNVQKQSFRPQYDQIQWRHSPEDFQRWKEGQTGYPLVDAGMRELNETGHMHNRVRMVVASFLCKHLLIHWREGERYFARKLLDYDLSANNGNWQWAAGSGCDAAPYFRIFNPETQLEKFDKDLIYTKKWVPEFGTRKYPNALVDHKVARERCLNAFNAVLKKG